jgi:hypothetical protein
VTSSDRWRTSGEAPGALNRIRARARALFEAELAKRLGMYHFDLTDRQLALLADLAAKCAAMAAGEDAFQIAQAAIVGVVPEDVHDEPTKPHRVRTPTLELDPAKK